MTPTLVTTSRKLRHARSCATYAEVHARSIADQLVNLSRKLKELGQRPFVDASQLEQADLDLADATDELAQLTASMEQARIALHDAMRDAGVIK